MIEQIICVFMFRLIAQQDVNMSAMYPSLEDMKVDHMAQVSDALEKVK